MSEQREVTPKGGSKIIIDFSDERTPTIKNYNERFAEDFGQYPNVRLIVEIENGNKCELQQGAQFTYKNGRIDTVYFDTDGGTPAGSFVIS